MPHTLAGQISASTWLAVCVYAALAGRRPEQIAAAACALACLVEVAVQDRIDWLDPERRLLAVDGSLFILLAILATTTRRKWIIPATAAQLLSVLLHFAVVQRPRAFHQRAYLTAEAGLSYLVILALAWGAWLAHDAHTPRSGEPPL